MKEGIKMMVPILTLSVFICIGAGFAGVRLLAPVTRVGGPCTYRDIPGKATITRITAADPGAYNENPDPVEVWFDFTPDDPHIVRSYRYPQVPDTGRHWTIGAGMNPSRETVKKKGITVGKEYRCLRKELLSGTCTPVMFEIKEATS